MKRRLNEKDKKQYYPATPISCIATKEASVSNIFVMAEVYDDVTVNK
jgi:hypothetical protein